MPVGETLLARTYGLPHFGQWIGPSSVGPAVRGGSGGGSRISLSK